MWMTNNYVPSWSADQSHVVYHGRPHKILSIDCRGPWTLASVCTTSASLHTCSLWSDSAGICVSHTAYEQGEMQPSLVVANTSIPAPLPTAQEGTLRSVKECKTLHELGDVLKRAYVMQQGQQPTLATRSGSVWTPESTPTTQPGYYNLLNLPPGKSPMDPAKLHDMMELVKVMQVVLCFFCAARAKSPAIRESAITIWGHRQKTGPPQGLFNVEALQVKTDMHLGLLVSELISLNKRLRPQILICSGLLLFKCSNGRQTVSPLALDMLVEAGVILEWRPHLLHDVQWEQGFRPVSSSRTTAFMLVEYVQLIKKLEMAGRRNVEESEITKDALTELHPQADHAMLFLTRRSDVLQGAAIKSSDFSKEYIVEVTTGDQPGSGTDSNIFVELVGARGASGERQLAFSDKLNAFERGQADVFQLRCPHLGNIKKLIVRNEGAAAKAAWKLNCVRIWRVGYEDQIFEFPFFGWLDAHQPDDLTRQELWCDPLANDRIVYEIQVSTADLPDAGAGILSVWFVLYGQYGNSKRQRLTETTARKTRGLFGRGKNDTFRIPVSHDLGDLHKILIGVDQQHRTASSSWVLDRLQIIKITHPRNRRDSEKHDPRIWEFINSTKVQLGGSSQFEEMNLFAEPCEEVYRHRAGIMHCAPRILPSEGDFHSSVDILIAAQVCVTSVCELCNR